MFLHFFWKISRILQSKIRSYDLIHEVPPPILRRILTLTTLPHSGKPSKLAHPTLPRRQTVKTNNPKHPTPANLQNHNKFKQSYPFSFPNHKSN